jgi:CRISPR/Cas system-associated protein endoribonuclease Cas2
MRTLLPILLIGLLATSCAEKKDDAKPATGSQAARGLDGSQKDLRTFLSSAQHRVVNLGPKRSAKLLEVLYLHSPVGVYATMITEKDAANASAEQIIVQLPKDRAVRASYLAGVTKFFAERGYPVSQTVTIDQGDERFLIIDPNAGGSPPTVGNSPDE